MHDGCNGTMTDGLQVLQKVRMMGFNKNQLPMVHKFECESCKEEVAMATIEHQCSCGMVYAVTPCGANDPSKIRAAGKYV